MSDEVNVNIAIDLAVEGRVKFSLECDIEDVDIVAERSFTPEMQANFLDALDEALDDLGIEVD